jgi:hypothetical protein
VGRGWGGGNPDLRVGRYLLLHADLALREHACPACGTLLESEVCRKDEVSLVSAQALDDS